MSLISDNCICLHFVHMVVPLFLVYVTNIVTHLFGYFCIFSVSYKTYAAHYLIISVCLPFGPQFMLGSTSSMFGCMKRELWPEPLDIHIKSMVFCLRSEYFSVSVFKVNVLYLLIWLFKPFTGDPLQIQQQCRVDVSSELIGVVIISFVSSLFLSSSSC